MQAGTPGTGGGGSGERPRPIKFKEVPPPATAPVDQIGETLGLVNGLRARRTSHQYRCGNCSKMQPSGSWMVMVPGSVCAGMSVEAVEEMARQNAYNGEFCGWCIKCAPKKKQETLISFALETGKRSIIEYFAPVAWFAKLVKRGWKKVF